jgi:uncharacterized protein YqiB (DUF1249 family)
LETKMARKKETPDERARRNAESAEVRRRLQARIDFHEAKMREEHERAERRRRRLRRLTFGLAGD